MRTNALKFKQDIKEWVALKDKNSHWMHPIYCAYYIVKHQILDSAKRQAIIEDDINLLNNEKTPITFSINTCCLYIDITKLFENSSSNLNKNEASNSTNFNYTKNLYIPEYYYFFFNRFQEKLISIITNHGGDIIFEGTGVYAIWPPEHAEDEEGSPEELLTGENSIFRRMTRLQAASAGWTI